MDISTIVALLLFFLASGIATTRFAQIGGFPWLYWIAAAGCLVWLIWAQRTTIKPFIFDHPVWSSLIVGCSIGIFAGLVFYSSIATRIKAPTPTLASEFRDTQYRDLVASFIQTVDRNAHVAVGNAIDGPDGFRRVDIEIRSTGGQLVVIDVLDRADGKMAGVEAVDQADSLRRDIHADAVILCSNTGFDDLAVTKARRIQVGLVSARKSGDNRIKAVLLEEIYFRKITISDLIISWTGNTDADGAILRRFAKRGEDVTHMGLVVMYWLQSKVVPFAMAHPDIVEPITGTFAFKQPTEFFARGHSIVLKSVTAHWKQSVQWFKETIQIDASSGFYDYVNRRLLSTPGIWSVTMKDVNFDTGTPMSSAPEGSLLNRKLAPGEGDLRLTAVVGLAMPKDATLIPDLDPLVVPSDLSTDLPPSSSAP